VQWGSPIRAVVGQVTKPVLYAAAAFLNMQSNLILPLMPVNFTRHTLSDRLFHIALFGDPFGDPHCSTLIPAVGPPTMYPETLFCPRTHARKDDRTGARTNHREERNRQHFTVDNDIPKQAGVF
ncbi:unnamed protein product, partial [Ectocarpus sp. 8 AP-2014]